MIDATNIEPDPHRSITPELPSFPATYNLGPNRVIIPGSPPKWLPQDLPISLPPDTPAIDPRLILPACPFDAMLRAVSIISPSLEMDSFDLLTDRKNLRALLNFVNGVKQSYRIDAELIRGTLLFYLGYDEVCLEASEPGWNALDHHITTPFTTPTGLSIFQSGILVSPDNVVEIKTAREQAHSTIVPRTLAQLWFSQTPILITGYHDGNGRFSSMRKTNMLESGLLKKWEVKNTTSLQKVVRLIEMIKDHLVCSPIKQQAIVLESGKMGSTVKFYSLNGYHQVGLPDDLRQMWPTQA
ncbi:hypothetical protein H0H81_003668 [Sphagnurus paluster]|uniref:Uncharacterized protein n=1 Tax=Sphagnurus paluster TaxID=117069 RepID=A0A9P7GQJ3_9AGAR|nr:hypothetical protein H0H81_003668 [Sphagnurus paluster]